MNGEYGEKLLLVALVGIVVASCLLFVLRHI